MREAVLWMIFSLTLLFIVMGLLLFLGWFSLRAKTIYVLSPYSKTPVRPLLSAHYPTLQKVYEYYETLSGSENRMFNFRRSVYYRETGRIFINCIDWKGSVKLDWTFLRKRSRGNWVSWGSLKEDQKRAVREKHASLEKFQIEFSSVQVKPQDLENEYVYVKPGPLYVDLFTYKLLGWQCVPETDFEVLVVQLPQKTQMN